MRSCKICLKTAVSDKIGDDAKGSKTVLCYSMVCPLLTNIIYLCR